MRWSRRALVAVGTLLIGYGAVGLLTDPDGRPVGQALFLAGLVVGHDGVLVPLVLAAGALIVRFVPGPARPSVQVAAFTSLALGLVALPLVLGAGRRPDDPSALPLPYGRGLAVLLAIIWAVAALHAVLRKRLERRRAARPAGARR